MATELMLSQGLQRPHYEDIDGVGIGMVVDIMGPSVKALKTVARYGYEYLQMPDSVRHGYLMKVRDLVHGVKFFTKQYSIHTQEGRVLELDAIVDFEMGVYDRYAAGEMDYSPEIDEDSALIENRKNAFNQLFTSHANALGDSRQFGLLDLVASAVYAISSVSAGFRGHTSTIIQAYAYFSRVSESLNLSEMVVYLDEKIGEIRITTKEEAFDAAEMLSEFGQRTVRHFTGVRTRVSTDHGIDFATRFTLPGALDANVKEVAVEFRAMFASLLDSHEIDAPKWTNMGLSLVRLSRDIFRALSLHRLARRMNDFITVASVITV